jgi:hypothetical protein
MDPGEMDCEDVTGLSWPRIESDGLLNDANDLLGSITIENLCFGVFKAVKI